MVESFFKEFEIKDINVAKISLPKYNDNKEIVCIDLMIHDMIKWYNKDKLYIVENYGLDDYMEYSKLEQWNNYREWENIKANKK